MQTVETTTLDFTYEDSSREAMPIARGIFSPEQQFDIYCFRSVMNGLLQLIVEVRRRFCIGHV